MSKAEFKDAPPLHGWVIGLAAGAVAFGASFVAVGIEGNGSVFIGAVVAIIVGLVFTLAESRRPVQAPHAAPDPAPVAAGPIPSDQAAPDETVSAPGSAPIEGARPQALAAPQGEPDDLKLISGIGPVLEGKLHGLGIYHFRQIAAWTDAEIAWVDGFLNFKGRITRDDWIGQAERLARGARD